MILEYNKNMVNIGIDLKDNYLIKTKNDIDTLRKISPSLMKLTKKQCKEYIKQFKRDANGNNKTNR
jgi:hypothetical protein